MERDERDMKYQGIDIGDFSLYFKYDPSTGIISWQRTHRESSLHGTHAGHDTTQYRQLKLFGKTLSYAQVAWILYYGEVAQGFIDHIDGNKKNNRINNLRVSTNRQNQNNRKSHINGSLVGAHKTKSGWTSAIRFNGHSYHLGSFRSDIAAAEAYEIAKSLVEKIESRMGLIDTHHLKKSKA